MPSEEYFYTDKNGNKQDIELHQELLDTPVAEESNRFDTAKRLLARDFDPDLIYHAYGYREPSK